MKLKKIIIASCSFVLLTLMTACDSKDKKTDDIIIHDDKEKGNNLPAVPEYVDLGLSVKWATFNVGATKPEEFGDYFAWGETEPYYEMMNEIDTIWKYNKPEGYAWSSYKYSKDGKLTKYCNDSKDGYNGYVDTLTILEPDDDVAHVKWGDKWRMPSAEEFEDLLSNCSWEYITVKQEVVYCWKLTSKIPGYTDKYILLPAAGIIDDRSRGGSGAIDAFYWTNTLNHNYWNYTLDSGTPDFWRDETNYPRYIGLSVRPVYDDKKPTPKPDPVDTMTVVAQKEFIEDVSLQFLSMVDNEEFRYLVNFAQEIRDIYEDYNWDNVEDWAKEVFEDSKEYLGESTDQRAYDYWINNYYYNDYRVLLLLSNFTGHFTASNNKWVKSDANDLQFSFKDKNGTNCTISLTSSGTVTNVKMPSIKDHYDEEYMGYHDGIGNVYNIYEDKLFCEIGVPENVNLSIKRGNETLVEITAKFNVSQLTTDGYFDLSKSNAGVSAQVKFSNGFKVVVDNTSYSGNSNVAASYSLYKNDDALLTAQFSTELSGFPSLVFSDDGEEAYEDYFDSDIKDDASNLKNVYVQVNLLDSIRVIGKVTDFRKTIEYMDKAKKYDDNENSFKEYVRKANENINVGVYYRNQQTSQANVKIDSFFDDDYYYPEWYMIPVIIFPDGSQLSLFEDFLNESDFEKLIDEFKSLIENYEDMLDL